MTAYQEIEDFTEENPREAIPFKIDDDVFWAVGEPPAGTLLDLAELAGPEMQNDPGRALGNIATFLDSVLMPDSAMLFASRMRNPRKPITQKQLMRVLHFLVEKMGGRPTVPASPLQGGQGTTGLSTTDTVSNGGSTPGSFQ